MSRPLISACIITYNQKEYIEQCVNGALAQICDFELEIIINDDNSTDGTSEICEQLATRNFGKISYFRNENNLGMIGNWVSSLDRCKGKYIAICEGDDYWIDPYKLQKQVEFLETNPEYSICFHRVYELEENAALTLPEVYLPVNVEEKNTFTIEDLANGNFIYTLSVAFRNGLINEFPIWFERAPISDYFIHMFNAQYGKIKFLPEPMAVYRKHNQGAWSLKSESFRLITYLEVVKLLIEYFQNQEEVLKNLKEQYSRYAYRLAELYYNAGEKAKYVEYVKLAFKESPESITKWLIDLRDQLYVVRNSNSFLIGNSIINKLNFLRRFFMKD